MRSVFSGFRFSFVLAHFCNHLAGVLLIPLLPLIRNEFGLDNTQAGFVVAAYSLSAGISQLPGGFLADRIGPRIMITISIAGTGLAGLLIGLSNSYILMLVFLVFMGIASGGYHPSAPPLLAASVPPEVRGKAFGFHLMGGTSAFLVGPLIAAGIATIWGWRGAFITIGIPVLIFGIIFFLVISRSIIQKARPTSVQATDPSQPQSRVRSIVLVILLSSAVGALGMSTASFITLFIHDTYGVSAATAAVIYAVFSASGVWASPIGGYLSDRIGTVPTLIMVCLATGPVVFLLTWAPYAAGIILVLLVWGVLNSTRMPATESYIISNASQKRRSTMFGIYYFSSQEGNGILTPLVGYLTVQLGYATSFGIMGIAIVVVTIICGIFIWSTRNQTREKAPVH